VSKELFDMVRWPWLIPVFFLGAIAGVFVGALLCAAGQDAARYDDPNPTGYDG
jgi:hypothetical protein